MRGIQPKPVDAPEELTDELARIEAQQEELENGIDLVDDEGEADAMQERYDELAERVRELRRDLATYAAFGPEHRFWN